MPMAAPRYGRPLQITFTPVPANRSTCSSILKRCDQQPGLFCNYKILKVCSNLTEALPSLTHLSNEATCKDKHKHHRHTRLAWVTSHGNGSLSGKVAKAT